MTNSNNNLTIYKMERLTTIKNPNSTASKQKLKKFVGVKSVKGIELLSVDLIIDGTISLTDKQLNKYNDKQLKDAYINLTYEHLAGLYNLDIEKRRKERDNEKKVIYYIKKQVESLTDSNPTVSIKKITPDLLLSLLEIIKSKYLANGIKIIMTAGNTYYTLNDITMTRLLVDVYALWNNQLESSSGSDKEIIDNIKSFDSVTFEIYKQEATPYNHNPAFFKYQHNIKGLDLSALQIYEDFKAEYYTENCFIHALMGQVNESVINDCKLIIKSKETKLRDLKKIAEKHDLFICVKIDDKNYRNYNKNGKTKVNMCMVDNHYFKNMTISITSYALENYDTVKNEKDWFKIIGTQGNGYRREDRFINSYRLVCFLLQNKEKLLSPIQKTDELYKTDYFSNITDIITLDYNENTNIRLNEYNVKENKVKYNNIFFDFETDTSGKNHVPYLCRCVFRYHNKVISKGFYGVDCGKQLLNFISKFFSQQPLKMIAHNLGYDINFVAPYVSRLELIESGSMCKSGSAIYCQSKNLKTEIKFQDSYSLIPDKLSNFNKLFGIKTEKEFLPYNLYTEVNIKNRWIDLVDVKKSVELQTQQSSIGEIPSQTKINNNYELMINNSKKWNCFKNNKIDIVEYSDKYCELDCIVLMEGYEKFCEMIKIATELDADCYMTIAQLADDYLKKEGCYDGVYQLNGVVREFVQLCMVGGRTMMANNEKQYIEGSIDDYDACSLYPSAMDELEGFLKGKPKILENKTYDFLKSCDGYFVEISISQIPKHRRFPLLSFKNSEGIRMFTDKLEDYENKSVYVDKTSLEDLIKYYQDDNSPREFKFQIIKGYYFNEGRNYKLKPTINHLYNTRLIEKKNKNPIQNIYKLIMNSSYGKSLLNPIEVETHYVYSKQKTDKLIFNNYTRHIETNELGFNNMYRVKLHKTIQNHFNNAHCGVEVLSMSKRLMNRVMCLAEDIGIDIFYQDTDSIHIRSQDVPRLEKEFEIVNKRVLNGNNMGQFHTDFNSDILKGNIYSKKFIAIGKKCYIDVLTDESGVEDYHIRMKGISGDSVKFHANNNLVGLYDKLYKNEAMAFDLCCNNLKACFEKNTDFSIKSKDTFYRIICFDSNKEQKKIKQNNIALTLQGKIIL